MLLVLSGIMLCLYFYWLRTVLATTKRKSNKVLFHNENSGGE